MANGAPGASGTTDTRVDRMEEGLPGLATVANPTANPPSRPNFDAGKAAGAVRERPSAVIYTDGTTRLDQATDLKRGQPTAW